MNDTDTRFDFDAIIDRRNSDSSKWNKYAGHDIIPMWVADMDFQSPPAVLAALHERVAHGVFGYGSVPSALVETVVAKLAADYHWPVEPDWLVWLPGLVCGLNVTCRAVGSDSDEVLTATPVYHHLFVAPGNVNRRSVSVPLAHDRASGRWTFDTERLASAITPRTRLFMLCNPHNPVGRVYDRAELTELARLCEQHDLVICADEIHCQLILDRDKRHIPLASLDPDIAARTITLMAPSKTYNLAGLGCSFAIIPNAVLRRRFSAAAAGIVPHVNVLGYSAALAAYRDGDTWLTALLAYLRANRDTIATALDDPVLSKVALSPIEATYLAWLDFRATGITDPAGLLERTGVGVSDGAQFRGPGFVRLNFGCPRATLDTALARLRQALEHEFF